MAWPTGGGERKMSMKRLTIGRDEKTGHIKTRTHKWICFEKLAAYEDAGLDPEEIEAMKLGCMGKAIAEITAFDGVSVARMSELSEADKDGRCVVLPCKVGDTVYVDKRIIFDGWRTKGVTAKIAIGKVVSFRKNGNGVFMKIRFSFTEGSKSYMRSCVVSAIGKTVFLTRAEAEAALQKEAQHE